MIDEAAVRALLRARIAQYKTITEAADALHVTKNHLYQILGGRQPVGLRLLKPLGLRRVVTYEPR